MSALTVSVVIPCYNEEAHIGRCLDTLVHQTLSDYEIIIVDDGSTDRTRDIVSAYPVRLLQQQHGGPGAARNYGARAARGDILVFVDADMYFDSRYLEMLVKPIQSGNAIATFHKEEFIGNPENRWAVCWNIEHSRSRTRRVREDHPDEMNIYRAILRSRFLEVGGFDPIAGYEDDSTLYPKLGVMARYAPGAICYHNNPGTLREIVESARWIGRSIRFTRPRKVIRFTLPFSFLYAVVQSIRYRMPRFFIFKLIHDVGILAGWLSRLLLKEYKK